MSSDRYQGNPTVADQALINAVEMNRLNDVRQALKAGANPNSRSFGDPVLHRACYKNLYQVADELLKFGANPNEICSEGETALHIVSMHGTKEFAELLLNHGSHIASHNFLHGYTCIHQAAVYGNIDVLSVLLKVTPKVAAKRTAEGYLAHEITTHQACRDLLMEIHKTLKNKSYR